MTGCVSLILTLLCLSVGLGVMGSACDCDCQQLRLENNLMKHLLTQTQAPVPELRGSFDQPNPYSTPPALPMWTESLIISTYKTLITSQALTEIPIWWRNRQEFQKSISNYLNHDHPIGIS